MGYWSNGALEYWAESEKIAVISCHISSLRDSGLFPILHHSTTAPVLSYLTVISDSRIALFSAFTMGGA